MQWLSRTSRRDCQLVIRRLVVLFGMGVLVFTSAAREAAAQVGFGAVGGVSIDPEGMLRDIAGRDSSKEALARLRELSRVSSAESNIGAESRLRKVSLRRLEAAASAAHASKQPLPAEIRCLAGLQQVRYVLFYPEQDDVVLAGPAGPWEVADSFDVVSRRSGRPILHFDDLCTALRFCFANPPPDGFLGCSIAPSEEGLANFKRVLAKIRNPDASRMTEIGRTLAAALGPFDVTIFGVSPKSRSALEMLAADFRLKRLAMGHDLCPVQGVPSYIDLVAANAASGREPSHRFWLTAYFDAVRQSPDRLAFELEGTGLRVSTATTRTKNQQSPSRSATLYTESMTRAMPKLVEKIPSFATVQNLAELAVAAELIRRRCDDVATVLAIRDESSELEGGAAQLRCWRPVHLLDVEACALDTYPSPKQTPSIAGARITKSREWVISISGGIEIDPHQMTSEAIQPTSDGELDKSHTAAVPPGAEDRWWWD